MTPELIKGNDLLDLVKFVMCTLVSRVYMTFYILTKGYTFPRNQGTYDKLNQIRDGPLSKK